jgi:hypothetical protein
MLGRMIDKQAEAEIRDEGKRNWAVIWIERVSHRRGRRAV